MARKKTSTKKTPRKKSAGKALVSMADIEKQLAIEAEDISNVEPSYGGTNISTAGKRFVVNDTQLPDPLRVIIVAHAFTNTWYDAAWDPNDPSPPACFALADVPMDMAPNEKSPNVQAPACDECELNEFGSAPTGKGKACQNGRRLIVMMADDNADNPQLATLHVSSTGIKAYGQYVRGLAKIHKRPPHGVVTEFTFNEGFDFPSLVATLVSPINDTKLMTQVLGKREEALELAVQAYDVSNYEPPKRGKKKVVKKTAKKKARRKASY